jgi:hypothetical protein
MCRLARESQADPKSAMVSDLITDLQDILFKVTADLDPGFPRMDVRAIG